MLQWGRNFLVTEILIIVATVPSSVSCFNGAVTFWLRKFETFANFIALPIRFNGAVTFWLRKFLHLLPACCIKVRFNGAVTFWLRKSSKGRNWRLFGLCFNGAVTFWLRKFVGTISKRQNTSKLQWGRNFLVTEMDYIARRAWQDWTASMGP